MSEGTWEERREAAKQSRRNGMSEGALDRLRKANAEATDWRATCQQCGEKLSGTRDQILAHECAT